MSETKQTCILHIGSPKTGTTSLQFGLANYDDGHTAYARIPTSPDNPNHTEPLILAALGQQGIGARLDDYHQWKSGGDPMRWPNSVALKYYLRQQCVPDSAAFRAAIEASISDVPHQRIIFSAEGLFSSTDGAKGQLPLLRKRFNSLRVVCYLRPCASGFLSRFRQRLAETSPHVFFSDRALRELSEFSFMDAKFLARWKELIPDSDLDIAVYDRTSLEGGDIVRDFCARLGLDATRARKIRTNTSFSAEASAILAALSHYGNAPSDDPHFARNKAYLNVLMSAFGNSTLGLSDRFAQQLFDRNHEALDWLDTQCGRPYSRSLGENTQQIDGQDDLMDLARDLLPRFAGYLTEAGGSEFEQLPRNLEGFAQAFSRILCQPDCFPIRHLPAGFDAEQYLELNPDVARDGVSAEQHFLENGCFEGRFF